MGGGPGGLEVEAAGEGVDVAASVGNLEVQNRLFMLVFAPNPPL